MNRNLIYLFLLLLLFMKSITLWLLGIYILIVLYGIYKYGFYGYLKNRKDTRSKNINKLVNYIN
jgi:hypothetical protein